MQEKSRTTKRPPLIVDCKLCAGRFQRAAWHGPAPDHCMRSNVERPSECWGNQPDGSLLKLCVESLRSRKHSGHEMMHFISLLAGLGHAQDQSETKVQDYLASLLPEERHILINRASTELSVYLAKQISLLPPTEIRAPLRDRSISEELPEGLRGKLNAYKKKLERRYKILTEKGHSRSEKYAARALGGPIRLAHYLHSNGVTDWDAVKKRDIVVFFEKCSKEEIRPILRFYRFIDTRQKFQDGRGRKKSKPSTKPPYNFQLMMPEELSRFLAEIRSRTTDAEYLAAWLVCRMGMTATAALKLNLDCVEMHDDGHVVIKPAQAWLSVPKSIEKILLGVLSEIKPDWAETPSKERSLIKLFARHIPAQANFIDRTFQGKTRILRNSAIFSAMMRGHLDRITLHHAMGVSMPHIVQLEKLLSTDIHCRLDPEFIKKRNKHILGTADD
ncbi:hypothetical protein [Pseudomonas aeruginosa]|uniref:hypothetical protein n=2 Tax=Pseudomonas aeruginosa TaxID=287 RepID=UPI001373542F|nr:hypothetical protein [Pseudomonas aeruginosa]EJN6724440.1 hypothetical protein [Pseudomonas aeruginosa]EKX9110753.1 hypothetical protein [Pseudomonas aeruginosa]EKZ9458053.1 hypothetical protein [Pseudomonas aeruginosa]ELJ0050731.1 hypothetical protein [Pseudomonas aeruginosa]ELJ3081712.1 hypothetical protein [Pseudomonas aeruginosa]